MSRPVAAPGVGVRPRGQIARAVDKHPVAIGCLMLVVSFLVTLKLAPWSRDIANDFGLYQVDGRAFLHGVLPYRDLFFEYPPLAAPFMSAPALFGSGFSYIHLFSLEMLLCGAALVTVSVTLADVLDCDRGLAAVAIGVSPLLLGAVVRTRFDLAPVAVSALSMLLVVRGRPRLGLAVLAAAVAIKGFPIVAAPIVLAWLWAREGRRTALSSAGVFVLVLGLLLLGAVALSPHGFAQSVRFQLGRPIQIEGTAASLLFVLARLGVVGHPITTFGHREWSIAVTGAHTAVIAVEAVGAVTLAMLVAGVVRRRTQDALVLAVFASLIAYAAFTAGFSPQYMVWSLPLFALSVASRRRAVVVALAAAMVLTLFEYGHFGGVLQQQGAWIAALTARNLLVVGAVWVAAAEMLRGAAFSFGSRGPRPRPATPR